MRRTAILALTLLGSATASASSPGDRFDVRLDQLPAPFASQSSSNGASTVPRPVDVRPSVPDGFAVTLFTEGLQGPREMLVAPDGALFVSEPDAGTVVRLVDEDGDGRADGRGTYVDGMVGPYGLAWREGELLIADRRGIWSVPYADGLATASEQPRMLTAPGAFGPDGGHASRSLAIGHDGRLYVGIGSMSNIDEIPPPRASVQVFEPDGSGGRTFASGLRNPVGLVVQPGSGDLWTVVNERDGMGDRLVPDFMARLSDGAFFGWPYAYLSADRPQPELASRRPDLVAATTTPDLLFEAHSAPLDLVFHTGTGFGEAYAGDAFVTLHGSWNRSDPAGYMVARVRVDAQGRPEPGYEAFMTGFRLDTGGGGAPARVWGRPAGIVELPDGSLLVSDDVGGTIWRVAAD